MLYQYHGNDMEELRSAACTLLLASPPSPLLAERLIVPNVGMAKWLRHGIAAQLGVAANLDCASPAAFLNGLAAMVLGESGAASERAWSKEQLAIRLMTVLPPLLAREDFDPVRRYLEGSAPERRLFALGRRLASLFDQYLLYRPHWLLAWETGGNASDCPLGANRWQALLWRALVQQVAAAQGGTHGAARLHSLTERLGRGGALSAALPQRVIGFGLGGLAPAFVDALAALATRIDVHLFQFNPCSEYWYDIVSERTRARWQLIAPARAAHADTGNSLLASWGSLGRTGLQLLIGRDDSELRECFREPEAPGVLGALQRDILLLESPAQPRSLDPGDHTLVVAGAHSPLREVEALQDHLLDLLARLPGLRPRDITVMAPDIGAYASAIDAVFAASRHEPRFVPFSIADRDDSAGNPVLHSFLHLLRLPESRFPASEIIALLGVSALGARFDIDAEALEAVREWVRDSGIRWGLDTQAAAPGVAGAVRNTWRFGLERMLLGVALDEGLVYRDATPFDTGGQDAQATVGCLAQFIDRLSLYARTLAAPREMADWLPLLQRMIADFYAELPESAADLAELRSVLAAVAQLLEDAGYRGTLTREVLIDLLEERLAAQEGAHQFLRGGINFCQLTPLRSIPFRVICLLGMNADAFPRNALAPAFDLMAANARPGDPSRRDDDRYLFLEALLSARDGLYISYVARDERDNTERDAAIPVCELLDYVDRYWVPATGAASPSASLTRLHRLRPFHPDYFDGASALFSYRHEWLPAARADAVSAPFCAEPLAPGAPADLTPAQLLRFFRNPCQGFFNERLGVRFEEAEEVADDCEPLALDGLAGWAVRDALLDAALAGTGANDRARQLAAAGTLPHGHAGQMELEAQRARVEALGEAVACWRELEQSTLELELEMAAGTRLRGTLGGIRGSALRRAQASKRNGSGLLRFWIEHLCCCAAGAVSEASELLSDDGATTLPPLPPELAHAQLQALVGIRAEGLRQPLPLFPKSAYAFAAELAKSGDRDNAFEKARASFEDGHQQRGEGSNPYIERAFEDADAALGEAFGTLAQRVFAPLLAALAQDCA